MKLTTKRLVLVCFLFASILAWGQDSEPESLYESLDMTVVFDKTYNGVFPTLFSQPNTVLLPVSQLLEFLKIPNTVSADGQIVKGFFENESNSFEIDYVKKILLFKGQSYPITVDEAAMDIGTLYLKTIVFKRVFGFDMTFNERSLSIQFTSTYELPLFKLMKLEKQRENLRKTDAEGAVYDTIMKRDYHWYRGQMVDWSVASNQTNEGSSDTRFELGTGAEVLGGETNIFLNYSTTYGIKRNQQQYSWRWANNDAKLFRQVQLGRISAPAIASVLAPVDGIMVTNALTTIRKALGTYLIADKTEPDWVVELYLNNQLMSYTRADATGYYSFKVPIVYGTSKMVLRFYGPNGEIRSEEKAYNMPFNILPKGELEYKVSGGTLLDSTGARFAKAEFSYGINRKLTISGGLEYLSSIVGHPEIPFFNFSYQPFSTLLLTGEYAHNVRAKISLNYNFPKNIVLDGTYARYDPNQKAIIYNYLEERSASLNVPMKYRNWNGSIRTSIRQNVYENFSYTSGELSFSNNYKNYSMILTNYANVSAADASVTNSFNVYGNMTLAAKLRNESNIRTSAQYNYMFNELISVRMEYDRKLFSKGHASIKLENNFLTNSRSVNLTFRYELPYMTTNASASISKNSFQLSEGASGSFAFNSGGKYVHTDRRSSVGRSGVSIFPFVDMNFNGVKDANEPNSKGMKVRCSGGQVLLREQDSIIRIVGLEPFVDYALSFDESGFDNVSLRLGKKYLKIVTDPNQFKMIYFPVLPMAEIYGTVADENGNGIGRIIVRVTDKDGKLISKVLTESDGYFTYIGYRPGDYKVFVDSLQLDILKFTASPAYATVLENPEGDVVDAGTIELVKKRVAQTRKVRRALDDGSFIEVEEPIEDVIVPEETPVVVPTAVPQVAFEQDSLELFVVLFDVNKTFVRPEYLNPLKKLAMYLNKPEHQLLGIDIQGHTDSDASDRYNLVLSNRRAESVRQQLVKYGVRPDRLKTSAFGKTVLVNLNQSTYEKAQNRRVIFRPIAITDKAERPIEEAIGLRLVEKQNAVSQPSTALEAPSSVTSNAETIMERVAGTPKWCMMFQFKGKYMFQVAAFKKQEQAMNLAELLKDFSPDKIMVVNQGKYIKVQLGYYNNLSEAMMDVEALHAKGIIR